MRIVIAGAGEIGFFLAKRLSFEKHHLALIDTDANKCARAREQLDVSVIQGSASSQSVLQKAEIHSADMLIAVTGVDEVNILACLIASKLGVERKIARVRNPGFLNSSSPVKPADLGVDLFIHPEEEAVAAIVRLLMRSAASEIIELEGGKVLMVGLKLDGGYPNLNKQLKDIGSEEQRKSFRVVAILKGGKTIIPTGSDTLSRNDEIFVITKKENLRDVLALTGKAEQKLETLMILGGGMIGCGLAAALEKKGLDITLVEADRERSLQVAGQLKKTLVVQSEGTAVDILVAEGLLERDAFVAVTPEDETNIITCLLAKHLGIQKAIALVNREQYLPLMPIIGVDSTVSVRLSAARTILNFIRRREVLSIASFNDIEAEVIEFMISRANKLTGKPLRQVKIPEGALIAAIIRKGEVLVPYGSSTVQEGDKVILFALPKAFALMQRDFFK